MTDQVERSLEHTAQMFSAFLKVDGGDGILVSKKNISVLTFHYEL